MLLIKLLLVVAVLSSSPAHSSVIISSLLPVSDHQLRFIADINRLRKLFATNAERPEHSELVNDRIERYSERKQVDLPLIAAQTAVHVQPERSFGNNASNAQSIDDSGLLKLVVGALFLAVLGLLWIRQLNKLNNRLARTKESLQAALDVSHQAEVALQESEQRYRSVIEASPDGVVVMNQQGIAYHNLSFRLMTGYDGLALASLRLVDLVAEADKEMARDLYERRMRGEVMEPRYRVRLTHKQGELIWVDISGVSIEWGGDPAILYFISDVTNRVQHEQMIQHMALHDALTGLPNRTLFLDRLDQSILLAKRQNEKLALLFIDLDKFKPVNDEHGHHVGDELLVVVANQILASQRESDSCARWGGDEFVVLLTGLQTISNVLVIADNILKQIQQPYVAENGLQLTISASIGVAIYPDDADNANQLMRLGDAAMYRAKQSGSKHNVQFISDYVMPDIQPNAAGGEQLQWQASYESGNSKIDHEHQELFRLVNSLLAGLDDDQVLPEGFNDAYDQLIDHMHEHFGYEEQLMKEADYPQLEEHQLAHQKLLEAAAALKFQMDNNRLITNSLTHFLTTELLLKHITTDDCAYFDYVSGNVQKP